MSTVRWGKLAFVCLAWIAPAAVAVAQESLHAQIDRLLEPTGPVAGTCSDFEFIRRASLDLTGLLPTVAETRTFVADQTPTKREKLIDDLLARPEHARHLTTTLDVMLMERRPAGSVTQDDWYKYLHKQVTANRSYAELAREILSNNGADAATRPAVRFYLDRNNAEPNLLTRDVGRVFFGRDLACAQCHDSPLIGDYRQFDYQGLLAYVNAGVFLTRKEGDKQINYFAEKASNDIAFESVFVKGSKHLTGLRLVDDIEFAEPVVLPGDDYVVKPADGVISVPKFSRRTKLAELATNGTNRAFNENIANRLWAMIYGRGLVHPVDLHHSSNPPSHPELMKLLGERIAEMKFDLRAFIRELALARAYQRRLDLPAETPKSAATAKQLLVELDAKRGATAAQADAADTAYDAAIDDWNKTEAALLPIINEVDKTRAQYADAAGKLAPLQKKIDEAAAAAQAKQAQLDVIKPVAESTAIALSKLANDPDLKAANDKLAARVQQVTAELAPLQKAVVDAQAAAKPQQEAVVAAQQAVGAALQKAQPLREGVRQKEQVVLAKRREMTTARSAVNRFDKRIETLRLLAGLEPLQTDLASGAQTVQSLSATLPGEKQKLADAVAMLTVRQTEHKAALDARTAAEKSHAELKTSLTTQQSTSEAVNVALAQAQAALTKLPNEVALADAVGKLKTRGAQLESDVATLKPKMEAAAAVMIDATTKEQTALSAMNSVLATKTTQEKAVATMEASLTQAQQTVQTKRLAVDEHVTGLTTKWSQDFSIAGLKPLTPEQMCWSLLRASGIYDRQKVAEEAELNKTAPLSPEALKDPAQVAARARDIEQRTFDKLKGNVQTFINIYGAGAGQPQGDFFATADQALFAANGGVLTSWAAPAGDNVTQRVIAATDPKVAAEELYLALLVRLPSDAEVQDVAAYLAKRPQDKAVAAQELVWSIITSAEFRFGY